jgi:hypothetical protein
MGDGLATTVWRSGAPGGVALRLGPLEVADFTVRRSGLRWLRPEGHLCAPGEVVAYCNLGLVREPGQAATPMPFLDEGRDLQLALATPVGGRLRRWAGAGLGGFHDFDLVVNWAAEDVLMHVEPEDGSPSGEAEAEVGLLAMARRRVTELAEERSGLMTGWFSRARAWRVGAAGPAGSLLSLGVCEMDGVIRGERHAFLDWFAAPDADAQIVFAPDHSLVPSARVVAEQIRRSDADREAIARDLIDGLAAGTQTPGPADWLHAGATLKALCASPLTDRYTMLTRAGLAVAGPPDAVLLSLHAEGAAMLRHRRLGYTIACHHYRLTDAGPAFRAWLGEQFEPVRPGVAEIRDDYIALVDLIRAGAPQAHVLVSNMMSTSGREEIQDYAGFDAPIGETVATLRARDLNLMLADLARERDIAVVDADAIAAEIGARSCLADGVHQNGAMQAELRGEIAQILRARGAPGFAAAPVS